MDLELRGKSVLITGVSKGIGLACAHGFAAEGANVHLAARNTGAMEAAAEEISKKYKVEATVHTVDLGVTGSAVALGQKCGHVDVLVKQDRVEKEFGDRNRWKDILAKVCETLPFKRTGRPAEVSDLVCHLASARASYISGAVFTIDGGASTRPRA
jgi:NAD(P)-dependent dehydrogenase (short-subunit alcohol dehydrogenase family)